jgi:hypothetical protein
LQSGVRPVCANPGKEAKPGFGFLPPRKSNF